VTHKSRDTGGEHRRLFEATISRDADAAAAILAEHFSRTANSIAEAYRERGGTLTLAAPSKKAG